MHSGQALYTAHALGISRIARGLCMHACVCAAGSTRLTLSEPSPASCNKDYRMRDSWACMASMDLTLERAPAGGKQYSPQNAYGITFDEGACLLTLRPTRSSVQGVRCFDSVIGFSFPIPYWAPTDGGLERPLGLHTWAKIHGMLATTLHCYFTSP